MNTVINYYTRKTCAKSIEHSSVISSTKRRGELNDTQEGVRDLKIKHTFHLLRRFSGYFQQVPGRWPNFLRLLVRDRTASVSMCLAQSPPAVAALARHIRHLPLAFWRIDQARCRVTPRRFASFVHLPTVLPCRTRVVPGPREDCTTKRP